MDQKKTKKIERVAPEKKKKQYIQVKVLRCSVARKKGDTYEWEPLRILARAKGNQDSFLKEAKRFLDATADLFRIPRIMALTDGCDMGRNFCAMYPNQAVWQLDWWHLFDHIHKGCKFEEDLEEEVCSLIQVEKIDEALALLHACHLASAVY